MKTIDSGYGNSGDLMEARRRVLNEKPFRYIIITTSGGTPGMIGGSFNYEIQGTNSMRELFKRNVIRGVDEIIDTKTDRKIKTANLAKQYLASLTKEQKEALLDEMLKKYLAE